MQQRSGQAPAVIRPSGESLADILERVLDKGVVIAGDIVVNVLDIELLTLKVRLLIASADTAKEMGIDWWETDPFLSRNAADLQRENDDLRARLERLERMLPAGQDGNGSDGGGR
ncbi:MAG TPA: gas vesicle protein [Mycobacteriales bacterium]|nr:gas vesicle protein [Mycobacteriales bacterium]